MNEFLYILITISPRKCYAVIYMRSKSNGIRWVISVLIVILRYNYKETIHVNFTIYKVIILFAFYEK